MSGTPKLSVAIVTYNHENFIAKALDSVLMQRVSFDYEILVGDDFSTDRTREILRDYERRWAGKVKPVFRDGNIGTMRNVKDIFEKCRGQYMALLAGDDYWTDPDKLQVQVDYLDRHPDCAFCHHEVDYISSADGRKIRDYPPRRYRIERPDPHDLSLINYVQAIAIVLRREYLPPFDDRFLELKIEDWPLVVLLSQRG
ncbi:MAG TPA: glycosyltransferase, partial [Verrucomicrobiae bacterium]|nr:glycosyltransferase [Verrucomicrobiae bacterium]